MRKVWVLSLSLIGLGLLLSISHSLRSKHSAVLPQPQKDTQQDIHYDTHTLPQSIVHTLLIPGQSRFSVTPAISPALDTLESFAEKHQAIAVLNGGFFDPQNAKSTSYVVLQGKLVADPRFNQRLMNNPTLRPYLNKILDRTEFRQYQCGETIRYAITPHSELPPAGCRLVNALGGGPRLLPTLTSVQEGFVSSSQDRVIRDPLASSQPDARTAVGITRGGNVLWVMVAQKPASKTTGVSFQELAGFMKSLGVESAMNLDGGSSSALYYRGKTFYGNEKLVGRPVKSVLLIHDPLRASSPKPASK